MIKNVFSLHKWHKCPKNSKWLNLMMVFAGNGEANEHKRCNKTKFILFKYKNPLSNSVQFIKFKSVLTSLQNEYRNRYAGQKTLWPTKRGAL